MRRRSAIKTISWATSLGILAPSFSGCVDSSYQPVFFHVADISLINNIGEIILPSTDCSPGAKEVNVAYFIDQYIHECYSPMEQKFISDGLIQFNEVCKNSNSKNFNQLTSKQKVEFLSLVDSDAQEHSKHYFSQLKSLIVFAYFTSKEGMEQALSYLPIPGSYKGNFPIDQTTKAWAI